MKFFRTRQLIDTANNPITQEPHQSAVCLNESPIVGVYSTQTIQEAYAKGLLCVAGITSDKALKQKIRPDRLTQTLLKMPSLIRKEDFAALYEHIADEPLNNFSLTSDIDDDFLMTGNGYVYSRQILEGWHNQRRQNLTESNSTSKSHIPCIVLHPVAIKLKQAFRAEEIVDLDELFSSFQFTSTIPYTYNSAQNSISRAFKQLFFGKIMTLIEIPVISQSGLVIVVFTYTGTSILNFLRFNAVILNEFSKKQLLTMALPVFCSTLALSLCTSNKAVSLIAFESMFNISLFSKLFSGFSLLRRTDIWADTFTENKQVPLLASSLYLAANIYNGNLTCSFYNLTDTIANLPWLLFSINFLLKNDPNQYLIAKCIPYLLFYALYLDEQKPNGFFFTMFIMVTIPMILKRYNLPDPGSNLFRPLGQHQDANKLSALGIFRNEQGNLYLKAIKAGEQSIAAYSHNRAGLP
ncbi:hypothetical protein [Legionella shakespearei]|uniref:Uncharacterized protein n=1 Tax=Legionella shakespearei DSM 23087 TaxID=1122169 RepID=A0A0W0YPS1_9GAMM|nr:hypothetical protein [Legionella shakespearei]KTD58877.1 hypothetical protein Lsha_2095 [Legionella shakespearei DSM 23087]